MTVHYELALYINVPVEQDTDPVDYLTPTEFRRLEREVLRYLKKLHGDCDCEVMEAQILKDDDEPRDEAYERAAAKARNNDFAETKGRDWT